MNLAFRAACGVLFGIGLFALAAHAVLAAGATLEPWLWPVCLALGFGIAAVRRSPQAVHRHDPPAWRWLLPLAALLCLALLPLVWGSLATPSRIWDGFTSWSYRAHCLTPPVALAESPFRDPAVFVPSRDYPALQPLCLGSTMALFGQRGGRILFPFLYLALVGLLAGSARQHGLGRLQSALLGLAAALTPMWLNPAAGAVDSGYAELFLCLALSACGAGLLLRDAPLLAVGAFLLPLLKLEGVPYGAVLVLVTSLSAERRAHLAASCGFLLGASLWLLLLGPLTGGSAGPLSFLALAVFVAGAVLFFEWRVRRRPGGRAIAVTVATACGALLLLLWQGQAALARSTDSLSVSFLGGLERLPPRLAAFPDIALGVLEYLTFVRMYGLLFPLVLGLLVLPRQVAGPNPSPPLGAFLLLGLATTLLALLLTPEPSLGHELASRFDRLLLQWVGVGWLLGGVWVLSPPPGPSACPRPEADPGGA